MFNLLLKKDLDQILDHSENILGILEGKRIFLTGGTGFFGKWILETFARANDKLNLDAKIVILTRNISGFQTRNQYFFHNKLFTFIEGDINNFEFPEEKFDYLIHGAAESNSEMYKSNPLLMFDTILEGTRHVLEFAVKSEVKDLLFISSGAIYGNQPAEIVNVPEDYFGGPDINVVTASYAEAKRAAEMLCTLYSSTYGISIKIARCFAFVGPYIPLNQHFAIGNFISNLLQNQPIMIKGDGTPIRSYLYTTDLVIWLLTILVKGANCRPYNVGSESGISIENLAKLVASISDKPLELTILTRTTQFNSLQRYLPSTKRAQTELGLSQIIDIEDSIRRTIDFYRASI